MQTNFFNFMSERIWDEPMGLFKSQAKRHETQEKWLAILIRNMQNGLSTASVPDLPEDDIKLDDHAEEDEISRVSNDDIKADL